MSLDLDQLFQTLVEANGSDLLIRTRGRPAIRVDGKVRYISDTICTAPMAQELFDRVLDSHKQDQFFRGGEADASYRVRGIGRFRANVFRQRGQLGFVFRHVKSTIPQLDELDLPIEQLVRLTQMRRGMILVTGTAGSGKSTTLAAMLDWINHNDNRHIVTLEDPVEFVFEDDQSTINQREVGVDTLSFSSALKHVVRQAPDVIMVGEMRDKETVEATIQAAETGHLVFSTLHTVNAVQTVERILSFFPPHHHNLIRMQLCMLLEGVISQRLIPRKGNLGRIPAVELLLATPRIRELLSEGSTRELPKAIEEGNEYFGSQTFNQALIKLIRDGGISVDDALEASDSPDELRLALRGISKGSRAGAAYESGLYQA